MTIPQWRSHRLSRREQVLQHWSSTNTSHECVQPHCTLHGIEYSSNVSANIITSTCILNEQNVNHVTSMNSCTHQKKFKSHLHIFVQLHYLLNPRKRQLLCFKMTVLNKTTTSSVHFTNSIMSRLELTWSKLTKNVTFRIEVDRLDTRSNSASHTMQKL